MTVPFRFYTPRPWPDVNSEDLQQPRDATATPRPIRQLPIVGKALADSIYGVTGQPKSYREMSGVVQGMPSFGTHLGVDQIAGSYSPLDDEIRLARGRGANTDTFIHEAGHRLDHKGDPAARAAFDSALAEHPYGKPAAGQYARTNNTEQFAEAFKQGVDFLRFYEKPVVVSRPGAKPGSYALDDLAVGDAKVPGTAAMVRYLLTTPTFKNHPNKAVFENAPNAVPADMSEAPSAVARRDDITTPTPTPDEAVRSDVLQRLLTAPPEYSATITRLDRRIPRKPQ